METEYLPVLKGCKNSNAKGCLELGEKTRYFLELPAEQSKTEGSGGSSMDLFSQIRSNLFFLLSNFVPISLDFIGIKVLGFM